MANQNRKDANVIDVINDINFIEIINDTNIIYVMNDTIVIDIINDTKFKDVVIARSNSIVRCLHKSNLSAIKILYPATKILVSMMH